MVLCLSGSLAAVGKSSPVSLTLFRCWTIYGVFGFIGLHPSSFELLGDGLATVSLNWSVFISLLQLLPDAGGATVVFEFISLHQTQLGV